MNAALFGGLCAIGLGSADFMGRFSSRAVGHHNALLGMLLASFVLVSLWMWGAGTSIIWEANGLLLVVVLGVATTVMTLLLYWGLARGPVSVVAPIVAAHPVLVLLYYFVVGDVRPGVAEWIAMVAIIVGVAIVAQSAESEDSEGVNNRKALQITIVIAVLSSFAYAVLVVAGQAAAPIYGEVQTLWMGRLVSLVTLFLIFAGRRRAPELPGRWWPFLAGQGLLDAGGYIALFAGSQGANAEVAVVTASTFGVITVLLAWVILRERINVLQWLGITLVFSGIAAVSG